MINQGRPAGWRRSPSAISRPRTGPRRQPAAGAGASPLRRPEAEQQVAQSVALDGGGRAGPLECQQVA